MRGEEVVVVVVFADDAEWGGLGDEWSGAVDAVESLLPVDEPVVELVGWDGLTWVDDLTEDVLEGVLLQEFFGLLLGCCPDDLVWEVILVDGEKEIVVMVGFYGKALEQFYSGNGLLWSDGEDVVGGWEEHFAEIACGVGSLVEMVVADEEACRMGVVEGVAYSAVEHIGWIDAAIRHEVVDVVNDNEWRFCRLDSILDVTYQRE